MTNLYYGKERVYRSERCGVFEIVQDDCFLDVVKVQGGWIARFHNDASEDIQPSMEDAWENARIFVNAISIDGEVRV